MPTLTDEIKTFIVKGLACFDTPSQVADAVYWEFGVKVTRQHVHTYDPAGAQPPAARWRALHAATRKAFLDDRAEIGIANRNIRLRMLDRMARFAELRHRLDEAAALLERAAKECGGMYKRQRYMPSDPGDQSDDAVPVAALSSDAAPPPRHNAQRIGHAKEGRRKSAGAKRDVAEDVQSADAADFPVEGEIVSRCTFR